ncbi:MAG: phenylacetic acid degradation protein PaaN [Betaproteobacteria bacterium]|nr:phenylacetic acid degradation protein PaaN [Betaproteobacteria bacterium]
MEHPLFLHHQVLLQESAAACDSRGYYSVFPESASPRIYGEQAAELGKAAFEAHRGQEFELDLPGRQGSVGGEVSPYGFALDIRYPKVELDPLLAAMRTAQGGWIEAGPNAWAGVCVEILQRLNRHSFEIAHAVMHTTGQAFMMAFQAAGPHAQDRGLEAVAYAWRETSRIPRTALWEKPQSKGEPLRLEKHYRVVPRGVALVIGCCTFPTWNGYPGIFASLATGNAVLVKPHPGAILPLAITVRVAREVLREAGFDPNLVTLYAHDAADAAPQELAQRPEVKIIDFTGSAANGNWLETHARQALVFTEKAGVNQIVIDSTDDFSGLVKNVAFSLALYSGQMCTAPQNLYLPRSGIDTDRGHMSFEEAAAALGQGLGKLLGDPARAVEILGAIQNEHIVSRLDMARSLGNLVCDSQVLRHPQYPDARIRTPLLLKLDADQPDLYQREWFGPIAFLIATEGTAHSLELAEKTVAQHGALTFSIYTTSEEVRARAIAVAETTGVSLSVNLTEGVFVNQSAAFSDYHGTGMNAAANASLTDSAYVANRFRVVQWRQHSSA